MIPYQSLDLHQAAHAHLCASLLKIKGVAESPRLPAAIKPVPKPTLSEEERVALHNVTSALCNRKQVKDVVEQAVMGTCIALRVPMPDKKGKIKTNGKDKAVEKNDGKKDDRPRPRKDEQANQDLRTGSDDASLESSDEADEFGEPVLLKRRRAEEGGDDEPEDGNGDANAEGSSDDDEEVFEGFSDSDAEERAFSRYEDLLGGSSDSESDSEEWDSEDHDADLEDSRDKVVCSSRPPLDDISISSAEESEAEYSDAESPPPPPPKKTKTKTEPIQAGRSTFLPTLMGGYISGSESASDVDVAPSAKKNRRGQRARQAIWEKKYGDRAKHRQNPNPKKQGDARDQGWDMRRGAVESTGADAKPWKNGIRNPFEKNVMHPERMRHIEHGRKQQARDGGRDKRPPRNAQRESYQDKPAPQPRHESKRDDTGSLHPSWAAAKKAKEEGEKVVFQGRKVTFD